MGNEDFIRLIKESVVYYSNATHKSEKPITNDDVYVVWMTKVLQNNKALAATTLADNMYYEITYNGDRQEAYVDAYVKEKNFVVDCRPEVPNGVNA